MGGRESGREGGREGGGRGREKGEGERREEGLKDGCSKNVNMGVDGGTGCLFPRETLSDSTISSWLILRVPPTSFAGLGECDSSLFLSFPPLSLPPSIPIQSLSFPLSLIFPYPFFFSPPIFFLLSCSFRKGETGFKVELIDLASDVISQVSNNY